MRSWLTCCKRTVLCRRRNWRTDSFAASAKPCSEFSLHAQEETICLRHASSGHQLWQVMGDKHRKSISSQRSHELSAAMKDKNCTYVWKKLTDIRQNIPKEADICHPPCSICTLPDMKTVPWHVSVGIGVHRPDGQASIQHIIRSNAAPLTRAWTTRFAPQTVIEPMPLVGLVVGTERHCDVAVVWTCCRSPLSHCLLHILAR